MAPKPSKSEERVHDASSDSESSTSVESRREVEQSSIESSASESETDSGISDKKSKNSMSGLKDHKPSQTPSFRPSQPYKPPQGFKSAKKQQTPSSKTYSALSNLSGKQVFHITAPAFLPLSKIKEVSLAQVLQGQPVLKHDGVKYGIPADSEKQSGASGQTLFLYDPKTQTYSSTTTNVLSYHIQEMVDLPGGTEYEDIIIKAAKAVEKPPRKQPKHLKMRFRPVGSGNGEPETIGTSSEESEGEEPTFKVPKGLEKEKERKRKHQQTEGDVSQPTASPRKKSKKHSESKDIGDEQAVAEKSKKSRKDRDGKKRRKSEEAV